MREDEKEPAWKDQVGEHYLMSMLTGTEPRGLPGTTIERIEFQRASEGRSLDDVIVQAHDAGGVQAVLEIQVKRSITFAPGDQVFRDVVGQIVIASKRSDFWTTHYELAIATARTSRKIDGAYQDVLTWARQIGDAATFTDRISRAGSANDDMRTFVRTFKSHLCDAESRYDDETVWRLLRKLQILGLLLNGLFEHPAGRSSISSCSQREGPRMKQWSLDAQLGTRSQGHPLKEGNERAWRDHCSKRGARS